MPVQPRLRGSARALAPSPPSRTPCWRLEMMLEVDSFVVDSNDALALLHCASTFHNAFDRSLPRREMVTLSRKRCPHRILPQDLVFPTEIVGKRTRCRIDGSKILKVQLDPKDQVGYQLEPYCCHCSPNNNIMRETMFMFRLSLSSCFR